MKKTNMMATLAQRNPQTGNYTHIERRVYEDENGIQYVQVNGGPIPLHHYLTSPMHKVSIWS